MKAITNSQIASWDAGTGGKGGGSGPDPRITDTQISNWDEAYSWGDPLRHGAGGSGGSIAERHQLSGYYGAGEWIPSTRSSSTPELWQGRPVLARHQPALNPTFHQRLRAWWHAYGFR